MLFEVVLFGRVVLSWFPITPGTPMASIQRVTHQLTEPVLGPVRRILPRTSIGLDFSPIVVFFVIEILRSRF